MRWFQTASRGWLTLAALSLLLSPAARRGMWLPLHLSLTGAASAAIGGAMPWFVTALTASSEPSTVSFLTRFLTTNMGVTCMAVAVLAARDRLLSVLVLGWVIQVLVGAWSYLLPTVRPGHPDARRRMYAVMEVGARSQVVVWNLGVTLLAFAPAGGAASLIGWSALLGAVVVGLIKAWAFAPVSRLPLPERAFLAWSASDGGLRA